MPRWWAFAGKSKVNPAPNFTDVGSCPAISEEGVSTKQHNNRKAETISSGICSVYEDDNYSVTSSGMAMTNQLSSQSQRMQKLRTAAIEKCIESMMEAEEHTVWAHQRIALEEEVHMSKWLLVFEDSRFEHLYGLVSTLQLRLSLLMAYAVIVLYSLYSMYGSVISGHNLLVLEWSTAPNAVYNMYWLGTFISTMCLVVEAYLVKQNTHRRTLSREKFAAVFFSLLIWLRCLLGNRLRVAELLGEDALSVFGTQDDGDDELLLQTSVLVVYLAMHTQMRLKLLLLPNMSIILAYPVSTFMTRTGRDTFSKEIMNSALLLLIVTFVLFGQRRIEVTRRRNLLHRIETDAQFVLLNDQQETNKRTSIELKSFRKMKQQAIWNAVQRANIHRNETADGGITPPRGKPRHRSSSMASARSASSELLVPSQSSAEGADEGKSQMRLTVGSHSGSIGAGSRSQATPANMQQVQEEAAAPEEPRVLPNENLSAALPDGVYTDWDAVDRAVSRIRDPAYSLKEFHEDMVTAFPELALYTFKSSDEISCGEECSEELLSSGRTRLEELARTFGALHSVYWLMRLDMDGKQGFCFGYDDEWNIQPVMDVPAFEEVKCKRFGNMTPEEKKINFYNVFPWVECNKLLTSAGLLKAGPTSKGTDAACVGRDRLKAMLVLTAIHDVMKNEALCPTVQTNHAPFCNYRDGQVIRDHDIALDYVLSFFGDVFPSYDGLDHPSQRLVKFTQGKMGFNNGWLVQGEAPPGALFNTFKNLIREGGANSEDVAFYFAHWVTDLAGAEPTPLSGSEKFVQKFPTGVLASFFRSFPHVWQLSNMTETQVLQEYLRAQWTENPSLGPVPAGEESIALMRLALHAQNRPELIRHAFDAVCLEDREVLVEEMARSGLPGQHYEGLIPRCGTPALLVYYAPAFLQKNSDQLPSALAVLAEVYRQGRRLFPLLRKEPQEAAETQEAQGTEGKSDAREEAQGTKGKSDAPAKAEGPAQIHTVTLRIEQLKDLHTPEITGLQTTRLPEVEAFFLMRRGDLEAVVERKPLSALNSLVEDGTPFSYLNVQSALTAPAPPNAISCITAASPSRMGCDSSGISPSNSPSQSPRHLRTPRPFGGSGPL